MADVLQHPTAGREPVVQHRRRGSYGKKIVSLRMASARRHAQEDDGGAVEALRREWEATEAEMRRLMQRSFGAVSGTVRHGGAGWLI